MNNFQKHYNNVITYNLITKFNLKNIFQIPKINKIILNIGFKNSNIEKKKIIQFIILLKLIVNQTIFLTKSKKNKINLKIKKGNIVGCKVILRKKNLYIFLEKLIIFIFPNKKNFDKINLTKNKNILNFKIKNILNFLELEKEFFKFQEIPPIDISIHTNSHTNNQLFILFNQFYFK